MKRKIAIVGSRGFKSLHLIDELIATLNKDEHQVVSGGAVGVDTYAEIAAAAKDITVDVFYPDWLQYGKKAGPVRNSAIVDFADDVYAFHDGASRGTMDTMRKAVAAGKLRKVYSEDV